MEGQIFDNTYRLIRLIGEGGMGAVWEATHARLAGRYAIKVLLQTASNNPEALARFHREARITSLLQHPNVVEVIDCNTAADGTLYMVMEYLAGESLAARLFREGPLPFDRVVGIIEQIAAGLAAAHAHGIVHHDLKPDNVFLVPVEGRETESVKILDFGISKVNGPNWGLQAPEGTLFGTPKYMSPEQVEGRGADVDAATDQFSLAVLAYEMLTGRNPFQGDTVGAIFSQVLNGVPAPTGVGHDVDLVLRRGLAKANRRRFPCVTDFADALRGAASGDARESQGPETLGYASGEIANLNSKRRPRRSNWGLTLVATVAASISMSFVAGGAANRRSASVSALTAVPAVKAVPRLDDVRPAQPDPPPSPSPAAPREIPTSPSPTNRVESQRSDEAGPPVIEDRESAPETDRPVVVPLSGRLPARSAHSSSSLARAQRPAHPRETSQSANTRPHPTVLFPMDDDATLPLDETVGDAR